MKIEQVKKECLTPAQRLLYWIQERWAILKKRMAGNPKPWTDDEILLSYRFCNVMREDDTVTKWITDNWREPNSGHKDLWFAMAVARWNNHPDTLKDIGFPIPWDPQLFIQMIECRAKFGQKAWTGAYLIGTQGNRKDKAKFIAEDVLSPLWNAREQLRPKKGDTLRSFGDRIVAVKNQGRFMVGQIVADIKYDQKCPLADATDWWSYAVPGPGSCRGINRLFTTDHVKGEGKYTRGMGPALEKEWHKLVLQVQSIMNKELDDTDIPRLHAQDIQNCLCEFDKYERVLWGEGKPRAGYPGK